jgi:hypothetical protein
VGWEETRLQVVHLAPRKQANAANGSTAAADRTVMAGRHAAAALARLSCRYGATKYLPPTPVALIRRSCDAVANKRPGQSKARQGKVAKRKRTVFKHWVCRAPGVLGLSSPVRYLTPPHRRQRIEYRTVPEPSASVYAILRVTVSSKKRVFQQLVCAALLWF